MLRLHGTLVAQASNSQIAKIRRGRRNCLEFAVSKISLIVVAALALTS